MSLHADAAERAATYRRLDARNRIVGILRIGIPALGALTFASLVVQIYVSSVSSRFGVGQITVTRESVTVDAPEYAGLLDDGSAYRVWAQSARAATDAPDLIDLAEAALRVERVTGTRMEATAAEARIDTTGQLVIIDGVAEVTDSTGTHGIFRQSVFDWARQELTGTGPVAIDYADGTTLTGSGVVYDAKAFVWTFTDVTVTLPSTPGQDEDGDEEQ